MRGISRVWPFALVVLGAMTSAILLSALLISIFSCESSFAAVVRLVGAFSTVLCAIFFYAHYQARYGISIWLIIVALGIYTLVGAIQLFSPEFALQFVPLRTTSDRGVPSLAAEPTNFGIQILLLALMIWLHGSSRQRTIVLFGCLTIIEVFLTQSVSALLLGFSFLGVLALRGRFAVVAVSLLLISALALISADAVKNGDILGERTTKLLAMIAERGAIDAALSDTSANTRIAHTILPWYASFDSWALPQALGTFDSVTKPIRQDMGGLLLADTFTKIMSFAGVFIFHGGILGLTLFGFIFWKVSQNFGLPFSLWFILLAVSAIPLSNPLMTFVLSALLLRADSDVLRVHGARLRIPKQSQTA
ncbi:hypothetical protein N9K98_07205 [Luminiphilus sp.]|nr:hypothetical protein [Luminiphilus sp.]